MQIFLVNTLNLFFSHWPETTSLSLLLGILVLFALTILVLACFGLYGLGSYTSPMGKYDNKCPRCAEKGIEVFVLPGKHCPRCNQPC